jgi:hypothetical protein
LNQNILSLTIRITCIHFPQNLVSFGFNDLLILKYAPDGHLIWYKRIGSKSTDIPGGITTDNTYIYVTGTYYDTCKFDASHTLNNTGNGDVFLAKYDLNGNLIFAKRVAFSSTLQSTLDIKYDGDQSVLITGFYKDSLIMGSTVSDMDTLLGNANTSNFFSSFSLSGDHQWTKVVLGNNNASRIRRVDISENGYYFGGYFQGSMYFSFDTITSYSSAYDTYIYKTNFNGEGQWVRRIRGQNAENFKTIAADEYDNIYILGNSNSNTLYVDSTATLTNTHTRPASSNYDTYIGKYNRSGNLQWFLRIGGNGKDIYNDFVIRNNIIYTTGYFAGQIIFNKDTLKTSSLSNEDAFLAALNQIGDPIAGVSIVGTGDYQDAGTIVNMGTFSRAYVSGYYKSQQIKIGDSTFTSSNVNKSDLFFALYEHPPKAAITKERMISCPGLSDGMLQVTPYFMYPPYRYKWSHDPDLDQPVANNLPPGSYTVTVYDVDNDSAWITYNVTQPNPLSIANSITEPSCYNYADGAIDITVTGGTVSGDYSYAWTTRGGSGVEPTLQDQTGISKGMYFVLVKDDNKCSVNDSFYVSQPDPIHFAGSIVTNVTPPGSNGSVIPAVSGGTSPYAYAWTGPGTFTSTEDTITGLGGGNYLLVITDNHTCTGDTTYLVFEEGVMIATISNKTDVTCYGQNDGTAVVTVLSGVPPFTYQWSDMSPFPSSDTFTIRTGMNKGTYYITVTDNDSHTSSTSVYINGPSAALLLTLQPSDLKCYNDSSGVIDLMVQWGTFPYSFSWSNGFEGEDLVNIPKGNYSVTVTDAHGCIETGATYVGEPGQFVVENISEDKSIHCFGDKTGELTAHPSGGIQPYSYQWDDPGGQSTETAYELEAGDYTVVVTDLNNCHASKQRTLSQPGKITVNATHSDVTCTGENNGQIVPSVSGGTAPFNYLWSNGETSMVNSNLPPGNYNLKITDYYNCKDSSLAVEILEPDEIIIVSQVSDSNTITVAAEGGTPPLVYTLNGGSPQSTGEFVDLPNGTYTVEVNDANNCGPVVSDEFEINIVSVEELGYSPMQIFPNPSAGKFNIIFEASAGETTIEVLDITGVVVYNAKIASISSITNTVIDLSGFPKGIYLMRINNRMVKERLIVQ